MLTASMLVNPLHDGEYTHLLQNNAFVHDHQRSVKVYSHWTRCRVTPRIASQCNASYPMWKNF